MNRRRLDRSHALSLLIAICLIASQFLAAGHGVHHATGVAGPAGATATTATTVATGASTMAVAAAVRSLPTGDASAPGSFRSDEAKARGHGHRSGPIGPDTSGHVAGDATCLVLAHLLLSAPPEAGFDVLPAARRDARAGARVAARPPGARPWSPSLPRGPPATA